MQELFSHWGIINENLDLFFFFFTLNYLSILKMISAQLTYLNKEFVNVFTVVEFTFFKAYLKMAKRMQISLNIIKYY